MSRPLHSLTIEALALDPADRLRLATELIDSVEDGNREWSQQWTHELQRRSSEADAREARGEARGDTWANVEKQLLHALER